MTQATVITTATTSSTGLVGALATLAQEAYNLVGALLCPRSVIIEVEHMHKLRQHANRIEAKQPARAAALRRQASVIGLR